MGPIGWQELVIVLIIALVIFGPKRLPEIGKSLGKGIKEFKKSTTELQEQITKDEPEAPKVEKTEATAAAGEPKMAPEAKTAPEPKAAPEPESPETKTS